MAPCAAARISAGLWRRWRARVRTRDDQRYRTVALLTTVQQAQRLDDPARGLMLGKCDGLAVKPGVRDFSPHAAGRPPRPGRSPRWWRRSRACSAAPPSRPRRPGSPARTARVQPQLALSALGTGGGTKACPKRYCGALVHARGSRRRPRRPPHALPEPPAATAHRRPRRRSRCGVKNFSVPAADVAENLDLGVLVHGVGAQAIDVGECKAGVLDAPRAIASSASLQLAAPGVLGELGRADPDDGGLVAQRDAVTAAPPARWQRRARRCCWPR